MNPRKPLHPLTIVTSTFLLLIAVCAWANPHNEVYVFGDSTSDNGNLYALSGDTFPQSPPYAQNNSNGDTWPIFFGQALGVSVHKMAVGGAFSGPIGVPFGDTTIFFSNTYSLTPPLIPNLPGLREQVANFVTTQPEGVNPDALFVIWAGHNDLFVALSRPELAANILSSIPANIVSAMCQLNAYGARHFAVGNLTNMGLAPFAQDLGVGEFVTNTIATQINPGILLALETVGTACADSIVVIDTFDHINQVSANPAAVGLANVADPCLLTVADPFTQCSKYLFWDSVHPTTAASEILSDYFRKDFCGTGDHNPGLRGMPIAPPPPVWRGVCYGSH